MLLHICIYLAYILYIHPHLWEIIPEGIFSSRLNGCWQVAQHQLFPEDGQIFSFPCILLVLIGEGQLSS